MAEIKSSIGTRSFSSTSSNRVYDVPDGHDERDAQIPAEIDPNEIRNPYAKGGPSIKSQPPQQVRQNLSEEEAYFAQAKREKRYGGRISPEAKQRIEFLIDIGKKTDDVTIDGVVFSLRTLKGYEMRESIIETAKAGNIDQMFESRKQLLSRSMYQIDGKEISMIIGSDALEAKFELVEMLDENVISTLYTAFVVLNEKAKKAFAIKTPEDVQEVVSDLKK